MSKPEIAKIIPETVEALTREDSFKLLFCCQRDGEPMPSGRLLSEMVDLVRAIVFPGYFGEANRNDHTLAFRTGVNVERVHGLLVDQIHAGLCFDTTVCESGLRRKLAKEIALEFISYLPELRRKLAMDVEATFNGDPAATIYGEVISCYPAIKAMSNYRIAHRLLQQSVPLIPRIITELAHSETGIDIHPGAKIGDYFTIDHGTGVVIGETCVIGNHVKLYQGVTLGAKSFPLDANGHPIKGIMRHPVIQDNVIIYSNATILGRITIGHGAVIGGNIWVTDDVAPGAQIVQKK